MMDLPPAADDGRRRPVKMESGGRTMDHDEAKRAIVKVGAGRGFAVQGVRDRLVITAGHCLPEFPPCLNFSFTEERTYKALLGSLGEDPAVCTECLFADPIGDVAVLGPPDGQQQPDECEAYETLVDAAATLKIADASQNGPAWLLSLDGRWCRCTVRHNGSMLWISNAADGIVGGMSGSPIVADDGSAIGIVCTSGSGPNPRLTHYLPGWLLQELRSSARSR
jgi:hypothetical protein